MIVFHQTVLQNGLTMTEYAVEGRYPGFNEPLSEDDWGKSVEKAEEVINWVKPQIHIPK